MCIRDRGNIVLIIDAKYYSHTTQQQFDKRSVHSGNLYQIFTYVKNKEAELASVPHEVSGMLLYAKTDEDMQPDGVYQMSGNPVSYTHLDVYKRQDWYSAREEGLGDLYEGLLEKNANEKKSGAGQYFTPRVLIDVMVRRIAPQPGELCNDPAAGTFGFMIAADAYVTVSYTHLYVYKRQL